MELTISGKVAEQVLVLVKRNRPLAATVAKQLLESHGADKVAQALLDESTLVELLTDRLVQAPQATLEALDSDKPAPKTKPKTQKTAAKSAAKPAAKSAAKSATKPAAAAKPAATRRKATTKAAAKSAVTAKPVKPATGGGPKRRRLNQGQIAELKERIVDYLGSVPAASRKQIIESADIPTPSIYNRVIGELRDTGMVSVEGEKAKAVYFLNKKAKSPKKRKGKRR
jgi:cobalamin biosynthesis Mg chelatase CobN